MFPFRVTFAQLAHNWHTDMARPPIRPQQLSFDDTMPPMAKRRRNRVSVPIQECYMCASPGITDEHVPPKSFFQPKDRQGLARVPSCRKHNLNNSEDVEEIRNN